MNITLRELFPEIFSRYEKGNVFVIKILPLFEKSHYLLNKHLKTTSSDKSRPIIITKVLSERRRFIATSSNKHYTDKRPVFPIEKCKITADRDSCFGIDFKKKSFVFAKNTRTKKNRYLFDINIHILKELENEGYLKYCGTCNSSLIDEVLNRVEKFFGEH
ncbi:hypothetical protein [Persephonella sp.]